MVMFRNKIIQILSVQSMDLRMIYGLKSQSVGHTLYMYIFPNSKQGYFFVTEYLASWFMVA